jgi:hypothetical protein
VFEGETKEIFVVHVPLDRILFFHLRQSKTCRLLLRKPHIYDDLP